MSDEFHARVKAVFTEAIGVPSSERNAFLERVCRGDAALREQVDALLDNHVPGSIIGQKLGSDPVPRPPRARRKTASTIGAELSRVLGGRYRRPALVVTVALALIALGLWTHGRVEENLRRIRRDELRAVLTADVTALEVWIRQQKILVRQWAQEPGLQPLVFGLVKRAEAGATAEEIREAPEQDPLDVFARRWMREQPDHIAVIINDLTGTPIYNDNPNHVGITVDSSAVMVEIAPISAGRTVFYPPYRTAEFYPSAETREDRDAFRIWTSFGTSLEDAEGNVFAALSFRQEADGAFSSILRTAQLGETGETYAFSPHGRMISESRFTAELRELGMLPERTGELDWDKNALLNTQVRDPGGDLASGFVPELEVGARPLTRLAALAVAARDKDDPKAQEGVVTKPYRNYRGVEVIGAWRWLPEYDFGVATEMEVSEAFAPLRYLSVTFGVLLALLTGAVVTTFASSFSVLRLRRKVRELRQLGPYSLKEMIGEGGMGKVYLAEHALLKRQTAVKILSREHVTEVSRRRFEREVKLASQLSHPNTISIFDYGHTEDGVFYYAMEYLDGLNLAQLVLENGVVPPSRTVYLLEQMCASLREAHERGLIHRDIKPQNIMVCRLGGEFDVVKVLDFGLVKNVSRSDTMELTGSLQVGGTPMYMAPERWTTPDEVDARADIYAVGAVAYYLLAARPIFQPASDEELLYNIPSMDPKPLAEAASGEIPIELDRIVMRCLSKRPEDRPASVTELATALGGVSIENRWSELEAQRWWEIRASVRSERGGEPL